MSESLDLISLCAHSRLGYSWKVLSILSQERRVTLASYRLTSVMNRPKLLGGLQEQGRLVNHLPAASESLTMMHLGLVIL